MQKFGSNLRSILEKERKWLKDDFVLFCFVFPLLFYLLGFEVCFVLFEDLSKSSYHVVISKYILQTFFFFFSPLHITITILCGRNGQRYMQTLSFYHG